MTRNAAVAALLLAVSIGAGALPARAADPNSLVIAGSTALLPLVKDASGVYQAKNPNAKISVSGGGSGTGMNQASAGAIDIGDSDVQAPPALGLTDNKVAVIGFAVITNADLKIKNLKRTQIQDIFSGKVTNWNQVGGPDQKVVVINRVRGSGTRTVFEKVIMDGQKVAEGGLSEDATGTVISVVKQTPGAISYAAFSGTHGQPVTEVQIDGVDPVDANILIGKYPFWSYEHMFTKGPATGLAAQFIDFVKSSDDLLKKNGFIKIGDMKTSETDR